MYRKDLGYGPMLMGHLGEHGQVGLKCLFPCGMIVRFYDSQPLYLHGLLVQVVL